MKQLGEACSCALLHIMCGATLQAKIHASSCGLQGCSAFYCSAFQRSHHVKLLLVCCSRLSTRTRLHVPNTPLI